jgi:hypothetical protein
MFKNLVFTLAAVVLLVTQSFSQVVHESKVLLGERNLSGPRLGITLIPGEGRLVQKLEEKGLGPTLSQFGWHFEWQIRPEGGGPAFVIETIPLIGGVEYGQVIPSLSLLMGVRMPNGIEFGMGPNALFGEQEIHSALILAVGKSFDYSGVSIPINLAYTANPDGNRISIMFGYAINR